MPASRRWPEQDRAIMRVSRLAKAQQKLVTSAQHSEEAQRILAVAQREAVNAIVDAWPFLVSEQRESLRQVLAGTIPANDVGAARDVS